MALNVGELYASLRLNSTNFDQGLRNAQGSIRDTARDMVNNLGNSSQAGQSLNGLGAMLGPRMAAAMPYIAVAVTAVAGLGAAAFKATSELGELAEKLSNMGEQTGLSAKTLQELKFVSENAGLSFEAVANASAMVQRKLMGVEEDSGMAAKVFDRLGISTKDASGQLKSMDNLFPELIKRFQLMENTTERNMLAAQVFGKGFGELAPLLGMTSKEMEEATKRAHELGLVMTEQEMADFKALDDSIDDIQQQFAGMWMEFAKAMLPYVKPAVEWFQKTLSDVWPKIKKAMSDWWKEAKPMLTQLWEVLVNVWNILKPIVGMILAGIFLQWKSQMKGLTIALNIVAGILSAVNWILQKVIAAFRWLKELLFGPDQESLPKRLKKDVDEAAKSMAAFNNMGANAILQVDPKLEKGNNDLVESIVNIIKKTRELRETENARKRDAIGWGSLGDVWKNNMVASMKLQYPTMTPNTTELRPSSVPQPEELRMILNELRQMKNNDLSTKKLIADRLGVYV